ncbi:hypothetical protein K7640_18625 [Micromonospora sp. PLK6-60]|uniref:hypothetical protein n=1 Tax=Micromonospora sp. PLK6-60 TaxID=2873383 RepID=UPI001CA701CC|nr:hypothetical protein [Micromonospora sp. PLK6-60]MBY8873848.1 hypothetical protein [Micromonospora sp. PLK6-60]
MAHGEADGCTQDESCRPGHQEHPNGGKHHRRLPGLPHPAETPGLAGRADEEPQVPRQRAGEPPAAEAEPTGCRNEVAGWAGAHRHGPVRPRQRVHRRERPPRRWC